MIPLIHFNSDRGRMKEFTIPGWMKVLAWITASVIVFLNARLVVQEIQGWIANADDGGLLIRWVVVPIALLAALLLLYVIIAPLVRSVVAPEPHAPHGEAIPLDIAPAPPITSATTGLQKQVAVTVDFSRMDRPAITRALELGGSHAIYHILHANESAVARYLGKWGVDRESISDEVNVHAYVQQLRDKGYTAFGHVGNGPATRVIPELVRDCDAHMLVMGAHGHSGIKDLIFGATVDVVRHRVEVPVLVVR